MCGIVGYVGKQIALPILIAGLRHLQYRGYDSAGVALLEPGQLSVSRAVGRIEQLISRMSPTPIPATAGIAHTRWASHGAPTEINAHPHVGGAGAVVLVHNGLIENYQPLRRELQSKGYPFASATDSEVIAHLIAEMLTQNTSGQSDTGRYVAAVQAAVVQLRGTYALAVMFSDAPDLIVAARCGSPLVLGVGHGEHFLASDVSAIAGHTDRIVCLSDHQVAVLKPSGFSVMHRDQGKITPNIQSVGEQHGEVSLEGYDHFMLKEIYEQPNAIRNALRDRLDDQNATAVFNGLNLTQQQLRSIDRIILIGCGSSWHSALVGEYLIEEFARIPVEVEYASELRYRNPPIEPGTIVFGITQSGETADTLAALREIKRRGHSTSAIYNVVGSSIAHATDGGVCLNAGPEIGVASTKAYTSQCCMLTLLALYFGRLRHLSFEAGQRTIEELRRLPTAVQQSLTCDGKIRAVAERYQAAQTILYLGRQYNFPTALEGALKLKEVSYLHAEGYPAAEMKHGPIALVDEDTPTVFIIPRGTTYDKVVANMEEIKARKGPIIAIACREDEVLDQLADEIIYVPEVPEFLQPIVSVVPLQLLAYHVARLRGCDVDRPRNLAKSVTVE